MVSFSAKYFNWIFVNVLILSIASSVSAAENGIKIDAKVSISEKILYVGQCFNYKVDIVSNSSNISAALPVNNLNFDGLKYIGTPNTYSLPIETIIQNGKQRYNITAGNFVLCCELAGKITIPASEYAVRIDTPVRSYHPFWGYYTSVASEEKIINVPAISFKVKSLPPSPQNYSGAVGEFYIQSRLPIEEGDIGSKMQIVYIIEGRGLLTNVKSPINAKHFPDGLKLKNITPDEQIFFRDGELYSRTTYICTFTASEYNRYTIPELEFVFFNPQTGKYETIRSASRKIIIEKQLNSESVSPDAQYI